MARLTLAVITMLLGASLGAGCADSGERGFKSTRPELMQELKSALTQSGVPFREEGGYIKYGAKYDEAFTKVLAETEEAISGGVSVRYEDAASRQYHKQLLRSEGIKYLVEYKDGEEWIRWYPDSDEQQDAIELKVAEKYFEGSRAE